MHTFCLVKTISIVLKQCLTVYPGRFGKKQHCMGQLRSVHHLLFHGMSIPVALKLASDKTVP